MHRVCVLTSVPKWSIISCFRSVTLYDLMTLLFVFMRTQARSTVTSALAQPQGLPGRKILEKASEKSS